MFKMIDFDYEWIISDFIDSEIAPVEKSNVKCFNKSFYFYDFFV